MPARTPIVMLVVCAAVLGACTLPGHGTHPREEGKHPPAAGSSGGGKKEVQRIKKRFQDSRHREYLQGMGWALAHGGDREIVRKHAPTLRLLAKGDVEGAGGPQAFKQKAASLLESDDPVVRAAGAILLGVIGDRAYAGELAELLEREPVREGALSSPNNDIYSAGVALGLMNARDYADELAGLLTSDSPSVRIGAAEGLGLMGARDHAEDVAKLLQDRRDSARVAAAAALARMGARQYIDQIAGLVGGTSEIVSKAACYALVRLEAREHADRIAELLDHELRRRHAARALALMDAREYTNRIAELLHSPESLTRAAAVQALGILGAKDYADRIAEQLSPTSTLAADDAATALILLKAERYMEGIKEALRSELGKVQEPGLPHSDFHPLVASRIEELNSRIKENLSEMTGGKGIRPGGKEEQAGRRPQVRSKWWGREYAPLPMFRCDLRPRGRAGGLRVLLLKSHEVRREKLCAEKTGNGRFCGLVLE